MSSLAVATVHVENPEDVVISPEETEVVYSRSGYAEFYPLDTYSSAEADFSIRDCEVIGNVYENPELRKQA